MADDFQAGTCSGRRWNAAWSGGFDGMAMSAAASCSAATADVGSGGGAFRWAAAEIVEDKARPCDEPMGSASSSSVTFQDTHKSQPADHMVGGPSMVIPSFSLSNSTMDWTTQALLSSGRAESSFHAMLLEDLSSRPFVWQDPSMDSNQESSSSPFKYMNQSLLDQHHLSSGNECGINSFFPLSPASHGCPATVLQGLLKSDTMLKESIYENWSVNYQPQMMGYRGIPNELPYPSVPKVPQFLKALLPDQQSTNQLHLSNNTSFPSVSAAATGREVMSGFYPSTTAQFAGQTFEQKPNCSNLKKSNTEGVRDPSSSSMKKGGGSEPTLKKPRIEMPSPLPTFKVRKEKLGDRITALQQLVSPFGKTDTASVLHETIDYIKFLHDQVSVLSTLYLKNGHPMQHQRNLDKCNDGEESTQDLRSRGLCLVPIASTYLVASETPVDFWTPTFGGTHSNRRGETSFHAMLQGDLSSRPFLRQDTSITSGQGFAGAGDSLSFPFKDMNQFLLEQQQLSSIKEAGDCGVDRPPLAPASYGCPTTSVLQGTLKPDTEPQQSVYDNKSVKYQSRRMVIAGA